MNEQIKSNIYEVKEYNSIDKTINLMYELENQSLKDTSFINWVCNTFNPLHSKGSTFDQFLFNLHKWINTNIKYIDDEYDETLTSPRIMKNILKGDCDDFSLFVHSILNIYSIPSNYILLARTYGNFSHIAVVIPTIQNKYLYFDGTAKIFNSFPSDKYAFYKII